MGTMLRLFRRTSGSTWLLASNLILALLAGTGRAELVFDQPLANAGEVKTGNPLSHQFHFVNQGPETVEVTEARASCGCLSPRLEKRVFQTGEEGLLQLEVNTLSQTSGLHNWRVYLTYRCGNVLREVPLQLTAQVITEITVQPAALTVFADSAVKHELYVTDLRPRPLSIYEVRASSPMLTSRVTGTYRDPFGHQVRKIAVELAADYPEGRHDEVLDIYTDDAAYRELKVPMTIIKRSRQRLAVLPSQLSLTAAPGQEVPSCLVRVRDSANHEVMIADVTCDHPAVVCQWAHGPGTMATVRINVDRSRVQGPVLDTTVHVNVGQPAQQSLAVAVHCDLQ